MANFSAIMMQKHNCVLHVKTQLRVIVLRPMLAFFTGTALNARTAEIQRNELDLHKKSGSSIPKHFNEELRTKLTAQFRAVERNIVTSSQCENDLPKEPTESVSKSLEVISLERKNKKKDKENYTSIETSLNQSEFKTQTREKIMKTEVQIEEANIGQPDLPASLSLNPLQQSPSNPNLERQPSLIVEQTHIFATDKPLNQTSNSTYNTDDNISLLEQSDDTTTLPELHRDEDGKTSLDSTYTARRLSLSKLEELIVSKPELRSKLQTKSPNVNALIRVYEKMSQGRNSKTENSPEKKEETIRPNVGAQRDSTENQGDTKFVKGLDTNKLLSCRFYWDQFRILPNSANTDILQMAE
ncbi:hypothetical protein ACTXT7_011800 [Hymenolepis weldensis]